jgi:hypothetical protein
LKVLTQEETRQLTTLRGPRETKISAFIKNLQPGESLQVEHKDWKAKYNIGRIPKRIGQQTGRAFTCGRMPDGNGWLIVRVK